MDSCSIHIDDPSPGLLRPHGNPKAQQGAIVRVEKAAARGLDHNPCLGEQRDYLSSRDPLPPPPHPRLQSGGI